MNTIVIITLVVIIGTFLFNTWLNFLNYSHRNSEIPKEVEDVYEKEEYKRWHSYNMEVFRFSMISKVISLVLILVLLLSKAFLWFDTLSQDITSNTYLQVFLFFMFYYVIEYIIGIFLSHYRSFVIEEKYGFNKTTKKIFITDKIKSLLLTALFGGGILLGLFALFSNVGLMFYVYGWASLVVIILIINIIYVSVIVPLFNKLTPLEDGELKDMIHEFSNKVGYQVSKISIMDASKRSTKLNAFFSGFGKFKQIVLFDTLIEKMSNEEIVAVLAHEIGHNKHKHIVRNLFQTIFMLAVYFGLLMIVLTNIEFSKAFGFTEIHFVFSLILFSFLLSPVDMIFGTVLSTLSRRAEYQADRFASKQYGKAPMISALKVLSKENFSNLTPHPLYVKLTYSHPPTASRIKAINNI